MCLLLWRNEGCHWVWAQKREGSFYLKFVPCNRRHSSGLLSLAGSLRKARPKQKPATTGSFTVPDKGDHNYPRDTFLRWRIGEVSKSHNGTRKSYNLLGSSSRKVPPHIHTYMYTCRALFLYFIKMASEYPWFSASWLPSLQYIVQIYL